MPHCNTKTTNVVLKKNKEQM